MTSTSPSDLEVSGRDGLGLKGRQWSPAGASKAVVLAVHGLKDHSGRYGEFGESLTLAGCSLVAFDLRGHGRSGGDRAWVRSFSEYSDDLDVELADVRERFPTVPIVLYGHSLGGAVAARYALDHPDAPSALVLSAPALRPPTNTGRGAAGVVRVLSLLAPHARIFRPDVAGFSRDAAVVAAMARDPLIDQRPVPARTASELLRAMGPIRNDAPRLAMPLLALHGTADRVTDPTGTAEFVARVSSPQRSLAEVPGAYHDLLHDTASRELRERIVTFVTSAVLMP